jgi:hypothetical protein
MLTLYSSSEARLPRVGQSEELSAYLFSDGHSVVFHRSRFMRKSRRAYSGSESEAATNEAIAQVGLLSPTRRMVN